MNVPLPPQKLFRMFHAGEISRAELQLRLAGHQRELIAEIEERRLNPLVAFVEDFQVKREAERLRRHCGEGLAREVMVALAEVPDFEPALLIWNANQRDIPFHCFFRFRREPIFRLRSIKDRGMSVVAEVEYGSADRKLTQHEVFTLHRSVGNHLVVSKRRKAS